MFLRDENGVYPLWYVILYIINIAMISSITTVNCICAVINEGSLLRNAIN